MSNVIDWIKQKVQAIEDWFATLMPKEKEAIHWAVGAVEAIKRVEDTGAPDFVARLIENFKTFGNIPTDVNNAIIQELPAFLIGLKLADDCQTSGTPEQVLACGIATFQAVDPKFQKDFSDSLVARIMGVTSDGTIDWSEAKQLGKFYYDNKYKKDLSLS